MFVSRPTMLQLVFFSCSSIQMVLFDTPWITKCLNKLFLLNPCLCFIVGFICDLFVACNDSWMSKKTSTRTELNYIFTTMEAAEGEASFLRRLI